MTTSERVSGERFRKAATFAGALVLVTLSAGGCNLFNRENAQPLTSDSFLQQRVQGRTDRQAIDQPGQVIVEGVNPPAPDAPVPAGRGTPRNANEISPVVRDAVRSPGESATASAQARAATQPAGKSPTSRRTVPLDPSGQYIVIGTVLARVSDRPIYAHRVLASLDTALRAEADRYDDPRAFRQVATDLITKEIRYQEQEERVYAVADKSLDAGEKAFARNLATQWQVAETNKAGGSIELAKRKWAEEGWDFNERLDHEYRNSLVRIFYQRRILPLVNVTASDIRRYYEANKDKEFTRASQAKYRVIKIDPKQLKLDGGATEAKRIAQEIQAKAVKGANFESLAREINDSSLKESGGVVPGNKDGWLPKNTYVAQKVDDAVFALKPGQVTDVIEEKGAFYVAKLEGLQAAESRQFEDLAVQSAIDSKLRSQQFKELLEQRQNYYMKDALVWEHPQMIKIALDMAMQRYVSWKSTADATPAR